MRDHDVAVAREADVELQRRHAQVERSAERGQRVLWRQTARAAVALHVKRRSRRGGALAEKNHQCGSLQAAAQRDEVGFQAGLPW